MSSCRASLLQCSRLRRQPSLSECRYVCGGVIVVGVAVAVAVPAAVVPVVGVVVSSVLLPSSVLLVLL
jgi:hypothetical protein